MNIEQFARAIGVSPTTVSRALSGNGRVSPATRALVERRMRELGYTPNLNAQRLVTGRAYTVALDWGEGASAATGDLFHAELTHGIQRALQQRGYGLLLPAPGDLDGLRRWIQADAVDGVVLVGRGANGADEDRAALRTLVELGKPCVFIGHRAFDDLPQVGTVVVGLESGARAAAQALLDAGHERIVFLDSLGVDPVQRQVARSLREAGLPGDALRCVSVGVEPEAAEAALLALYDDFAPTAVLARTDTLALGALRAARRLGLKVPDDLSVIGHDDTPMAAFAEPPLTTIRVDCTQLGERAMALLLARIDGADTPGEPPAVVETFLVERHSVAPARR